MPRYVRFLRHSHFKDAHHWRTPADVTELQSQHFRKGIDGTVSFYFVDDTEKSLRRLVVAFVVSHPNQIEKCGYRYVDEAAFQDFIPRLTKSQGETPDREVNDWHFEIVEPSEEEVLNITFTLGRLGTGDQWSVPKLRPAIVEAYRAKDIDIARMSVEVRKQVLTICG